MRSRFLGILAATLLVISWLGCSPDPSDPSDPGGTPDTQCPVHEPAAGRACAMTTPCAYAGGDSVDFCAPVSIIDACRCDEGAWTCESEDHACGDHSGEILTCNGNGDRGTSTCSGQGTCTYVCSGGRKATGSCNTEGNVAPVAFAEGNACDDVGPDAGTDASDVDANDGDASADAADGS
jgi:hypothetical protein